MTTSLLQVLLPPVKSTATAFYDHSNDPWFKYRSMESEAKKFSGVIVKPVPAYMNRQGFRPDQGFGDGGAFPEIHVSQYPLGMGKNRSNKTLPVTLDAQGNVVFDAVVRQQSEITKKIVYSRPYDVIPKILKNEGDLVDDEELKKQIHETTEETKAAIEKIVNARLRTSQPSNVPKASSDSAYIKYKPSQQSAAFNSGARERIVRMVDMPVDPLDLPKFKHKRVPKASGSPPVPVLHSPPRPVTVKDKQDWNIPPCISNWKNQKGYTIPLEKRLAADGRGLEDAQVNDDFAKLTEALYVAEQKAREAVSVRLKVQKEMVMKEKERKEQELRDLTQKARRERAEAAVTISSESVERPGGDCETERKQRDKIREERRKERERERRLETAGKKSKITRDSERDITEKVALGMATVGGRGGEVMYDQRLFNQDKGMDSGFAIDDQYNVYDKTLFTVKPTLSTLYKPKKDMDDEMYHEQLQKPMNTDKFKPDKSFTGAGKRERPLEFNKEAEEDPFGLAQWACNVKKGKKHLGSGSGTMRASGGGCSSSEDYYGGSARTKINFERLPRQ
ncbi:PREDICTED: SNW/SKI-interacting protein-like [Camelina sativa]|uniref:SNW/SKI-interacting protein-like n=1 Tax=Camelina sativa TaxID=90675 RepID=A0ABM0VI05_CAMSA|nr:PREDICTED: SNW/SKI-interacting protein-like [Camelina sativa]